MRNIPEDNLAYPILLNLDSGSSGSGFLLSTENTLYLITAKHVLYDEEKLRGNYVDLTCQNKEIDNDSIYRIRVDLIKAVPIIHDTADVVAIKFGTREKKEDDKKNHHVEYVEGISILEGAPFTVSVNANTTTKRLSDVLISNDVFLYGYPSSLGLKDSPQFDYSKPLLRKGIVANVNPVHGTIILDCPVYFGNSGGPVVEVEKIGLGYHHKVIGVVSQFIPFVQQWHNPPTGLVNTEFLNSGYSVAVCMDKVFEIIEFKP